ncbi:AcrB/AcrD/AcrF family protein [Chitinophaga ginsengisegetis]|uniref:AcrB/AcrD/AcrF family protein n=1 Tax=Chitinophaga ginsengisegetis TaxID=393003 RepID=A0A1T5N375_9BACT|nr:efflux RND transporter permease subunit [Chitinophaga ginsengisegetis]SKC94935.1 AcrB/AcrD/AcrF family protein [Chitinophaga ginsengisegetis]
MFKKLLKWLVSATVIYTISIILVSCAGMASPGQQLPHMALPSIQVRALYPGADVRMVLGSVTPPLKDSIFHNVENMDYMTYTASSDGSLIITVYFKPGTDLDLAAVNISNLVSVASGQLPAQVVQSGITVLRKNEPIVMAVNLYSENTGPYDQAFLANYAATNIVPGIQRVPGVSHLITFDENKDSLMRIWLNKEHMAALNLTLKEVLATIPDDKLEAVTGILYKNGKRTSDYIIKCKSEHTQLVEYGNMIVRSNADTALRLKDVAAKVEFGPYTYGNFSRINGKTGISIVVTQAADLNYNEVQMAVKKLMETASMNFPAGIKHLILYNPKDSVYISGE